MTVCHGVDGVDEVIRGRVLEQEAAGARGERLVDVLVEIERGKDHDPWPCGAREQSAGRLDAVESWHADIHQNDVCLMAEAEIDGFVACSGLADDGDVWL